VPAPDYATFYPHLSAPMNLDECKWANSGHRPKAFLAAGCLDHVAPHKRHKASQVIKDKDVVLRNATATDVIVPAGENVVHINCVAHAHMHVEKCAPGNLEHPDALVCCLSWLRKIDEGNKVSGANAFEEHTRNSQTFLLCSAHVRAEMACTAHAMSSLSSIAHTIVLVGWTP